MDMLTHTFVPAYIDGGSASMAFQALIGGLLAAGYLFSSRFDIVVGRFRKVLQTRWPRR